MKIGKVVFSIVAMACFVALVVPAGSACVGNFFGRSDGGASDMVGIMNMVPADATSFCYMDMEELRDLSDDEQDEDSSSGGPDISGIEGDQVDGWAMAHGEELFLLFYSGDFNADDVAAGLGSEGLTKSEYKGITVWARAHQNYDDDLEYIAFIDGLIVCGDEESVKACIRVSEEGDASLYDNEDCRDILDRLADGWSMSMGFVDGEHRSDDGMIATGESCETKDSGTWIVSEVFKFVDEDSAAAAMDDIKADLGPNKYNSHSNVNVTQNGQYVEATYGQSIADASSD